MTPENFCYWLQGFMELTSNCGMSPEQFSVVRKHLDTVFAPVTRIETTPEVQLRKALAKGPPSDGRIC